MRFADVIGHGAVKERLIRGVEQGRIAHAQLFSGMAGYGGLPLALAYAQYINCTNRVAGDSCGCCPSCFQMGGLAHPDLHIVMPVNRQGKKSGEKMLSSEFMPLFREIISKSGGYTSPSEWYDALQLGKTLKGAISAHEADDIVTRLSYKSFTSGYKVVLIWLPEMMSEQGANKLLKILEEPWERTLFLLVSQSPEMLLSTIISRTQELSLPRIEMESLKSYAQDMGVPSGARLDSVVHLAAGDLLELRRLIRGDGEEQRGEYFDYFTSLMRLSYNDKHIELINWADDLGHLSRAEQLGFLRYSLELLREAYIRNLGLEGSLCYTWGEEALFCTKFAPFINNSNIEFLISHIELSIAQITQNINPTILFTHFALRVSKEIRGS